VAGSESLGKASLFVAGFFLPLAMGTQNRSPRHSLESISSDSVAHMMWRHFIFRRAVADHPGWVMVPCEVSFDLPGRS